MGNFCIGWRNHVLTGPVVTSGGASPDLDGDQLQDDQGNAASAWQTPAGATSGAVLLTRPVGTRWRAFGLFRTNLTAAALVDWYVGTALTFAALTIPTDTLAGAVSVNATRLGPDTSAPNGAGVFYRNGTGGSYVGKIGLYECRAGVAYTVGVWFRRALGATTTGSVIAVQHFQGGGQVFTSLPMTAVPNDNLWRYYTHSFTPDAPGLCSVLFGNNTDALDYAIAGGTLTSPVVYSARTAQPVVPGYGQAVHVAPYELEGETMQVNIADPTNPDGSLNVPLMFAGPVWQGKRNYSYQSAPGRDAGGVTLRTRSGGVTRRTDWVARTFDLSLAGIDAAEVEPHVMPLDLAARRGGNVLLVPNPDSASVQTQALFGQCEPQSGVGYPFTTGQVRAWRATFAERL